MNKKTMDRIEALEARIAALEERSLARRTVRTRQYLKGVLLRWKTNLREKLRPKINRLHHYPPRDLDVPESYREFTLAGRPPTFAIVTPSYNQARFIGATVDSVLGQGYPALNFHVQDAKSCDGTIKILKSRNGQFSWCSSADRGQAHGLNLGFDSLQGEIMSYLNSDDLLLPGTLAYVARAFASGLVGSQCLAGRRLRVPSARHEGR